MDRGTRMFHRDKNFPCIIIWSLGNEAGIGPAHFALASFLRASDPSRLVQYEGGGSSTSCTDIICPMYATVDQCRDLANKFTGTFRKKKAFTAHYIRSL